VTTKGLRHYLQANIAGPANASLAALTGRISLALAQGVLAMTCWRSSLAHGSTDSPAAQSLRDRQYAARLCRRCVICKLGREQ